MTIAEPGNATANEAAATPANERPREKLPYASPRLRHLGSVRELTLGGTGNAGDGLGGKRVFPPGM